MELAVAFLAASSIFFLTMHLIQRASRRDAALSAVGMRSGGGENPAPRARLRPLLREQLGRLGRTAAPRPGPEIHTLLEEAGSEFPATYFQGMRVACALAAAAFSLPLGRAALMLAPLSSILAYHMPVFFLKRRRQRRWELIARDLPEVVDLMAVLCYAGESLFLALSHSVNACAHDLSRREIEAIVERIRLGESAAESLRRTAQHPCPELRRFSRSLLRAEEHGAPVAETLEELAGELRSGRREKERVRAARASVLILFPLVFLILPSFLLLTVGGMLLGYTL